MSATPLNLGPGKISDTYDIPSTDWEIANKRVSVILDPSRAPALQNKLHALPNYAQLLVVAKKWQTSTFNSLVTFSTNLAQFSQTDVQSYLTVLGMIIDALVAGDTKMKSRLEHTVAGFTTDTCQLSVQAADLAEQLKAFDIQMSQSDVISEDPNDPVWGVFSLNAGLSFDVLSGRFQSITSDLTSMQKEINKKIANDMPIVVQLVDLSIAKQRWQTIGDYANGFVTNAPAQRKFLDGNWS